MNRIALVSATWLEIEPTLNFLQQYQGLNPETFFYGRLEIIICVTGAGMVNTAFELGRLKDKNIVYAINAGVAGSFGKFQIGEVVNVNCDCFSELGAEDGDKFITMDELELGKQSVQLTNKLELDFVEKFPKAGGITVNTVHGNKESIKKIIERCSPDVESMEGGAFVFASNAFNWKAIQLRAISNMVEERNKEKWNMPLAITNLNEAIIDLLEHLNKI